MGTSKKVIKTGPSNIVKDRIAEKVVANVSTDKKHASSPTIKKNIWSNEFRPDTHNI